jgi:A/G-specific adenine glycosylase
VKRRSPRAQGKKRPAREQPDPGAALPNGSAALPKGSAPLPLAAPLLAWFEAARRELPWRTEPRDPYRTWLSEVMLQQTRVDVVVPYYTRFLERFPTLQALAEGPLDAVLALWSGLGYYARARNLHAAAQAAMERHGGLPRTAAELSALPGFGPYTTNAVASLAFGEDVPLVDGNVGRVLARVLLLPGDPVRVRALAWEAAPALLPKGKAGPFNEALMELGATVCTPRGPGCARCPLEGLCGAARQGDPERFPAPKPQRERPQVEWAALCLRREDGAVLLARHGPAAEGQAGRGRLFAGLWDLPSVALLEPPGGPLFAKEAAQAALGALGPLGLDKSNTLSPGALRPLGAVEQTLTHRELRVHLFGASLQRGSALLQAALDPARARWVEATAEALGGLGLSSLARKSLRACGLPAPKGAR